MQRAKRLERVEGVLGRRCDNGLVSYVYVLDAAQALCKDVVYLMDPRIPLGQQQPVNVLIPFAGTHLQRSIRVGRSILFNS